MWTLWIVNSLISIMEKSNMKILKTIHADCLKCYKAHNNIKNLQSLLLKIME
jgi:hypothetical protein